MIPQVFHRIWFGNKQIPSDYEKFWESWQRQFPQYTFITWRDRDLEKLPLSLEKVKEAKSIVTQADIARYEILFQFGGIYLDCDMMPYNYFDPAQFNCPLIVCNEIKADTYCSIGFIASEPAHPVLRWAVEEIIKRPLGLAPPNRETGPYFFKEALMHGPYMKLPTENFYPYLYNEPLSAVIERDLSKTYGIHIWGGAWFEEEQNFKKVLQRLGKGDIEECRLLLSKLSPQIASPIEDFCQSIQRTREEMLNTIKHPIGINFCQLSAVTPFEFLKTSFFLLDQEPEAIVWQIGAADGILSDPLRPLLIKYDPISILLEPNPYLFKKLKNNYANNKNIKFIPAALAATKGSISLNAINPLKIKEKGLPDWAYGISSVFKDRNAIGGIDSDPKTTQLINECLETIEVLAIDVFDLLKESQGKHPEILVIDAEGLESTLLRAILSASINPSIIYYEIQCMPASEIKILEKELDVNYVLIKLPTDTIAYKKDFFTRYCDYLFIQYGMPTIYS
jgi:FkbM family methyltransferase